MTRLFGRVVELQIGIPGEEASVWRGLRVGFQVDYIAGKAGKASVEVFGASGEMAALAARPGAVVRLLAGYRTTGPGLIFTGGPRRRDGVQLIREAPEVVLRLELRDAARALAGARIALTYSETVTLERAVADVAEQLGLSRRIDLGDAARRELPAGAVLRGEARAVLEQLLEDVADYDIQGGRLGVRPLGGANGEPVVVFSSATGNLVGTPTVDKKGRVEAVGLLTPAMRVGRRFVVEQPDDAGRLERSTWRATAVGFGGGEWDNDFYVTMKGRKV